MVDTNWQFYKEISLSSSVPLSNYQVEFKVYWGPGVSSGNTIYTDYKCQNTFDDIRFTNDSGDNLPYYIAYADGNSASIWVKVDSIGEDTTIRIYYGNENATPASNGTDTFIFFYHYTEFTLDYFYDRWSLDQGNCNMNSGTFVVQQPFSTVSSTTPFPVNTAMHICVVILEIDEYAYWGIYSSEWMEGHGVFFVHHPVNNTINFVRSSQIYETSDDCHNDETYLLQEYEIQRHGTSSIVAKIEGGVVASGTTEFPTGDCLIRICAEKQDVYVSYAFVRNFSSSGVSYDGIGEEKKNQSEAIGIEFVSEYNILSAKEFKSVIRKIRLNHKFTTITNGTDPVSVEFRTRVSSVTGIAAPHDVI